MFPSTQVHGRQECFWGKQRQRAKGPVSDPDPPRRGYPGRKKLPVPADSHIVPAWEMATRGKRWMMIPFEVVLLGTEPNEFNRLGSKKRTLRDFFRNHHGRESSPQEIRIDGRKVLGSRKTVDPGDGKGPMNSASSRSHILKVLVFLLVFPIPAAGEVITRLPTREPRIALTFDACEMGQPHYLDAAVLDTLLSEQIPFTLFVSGKFARRNREELRRIAARDFVEVENHSLSHHHHMERLEIGRASCRERVSNCV